MENKALLWFKPEKIGWLLLRRGSLVDRQWKKLHCMIKGNNFFYIHRLNRPEPTGLLPLEGCAAEVARHDVNDLGKHCFIIIMKTPVEEDGVNVNKNYLFAAESMLECQAWVDAINYAAESKHILRLKLEHAQKELQDLELRWSNAEDQDLGKEVASTVPPGEEDPIVLQALADELVHVYHSANLARQSIIAARRKVRATTHHTAKLRKATAMLDAQVHEHQRPLIKHDVQNANECLEWLLPARYSLRDLAREVEVLEGSAEFGPEVAVMEFAESVLQGTLRKIAETEYPDEAARGLQSLPDEGKLWELRENVNSMYEAEAALMQRAFPGERVETVVRPGRHRLSSFFAPEPATPTKDKGDGDAGFGDNTTGWNSEDLGGEEQAEKRGSVAKGEGAPARRSSVDEEGDDEEDEVDDEEEEGRVRERQSSPRTQSLLLPHLQGVEEEAGALKKPAAGAREREREASSSPTSRLLPEIQEAAESDKEAAADEGARQGAGGEVVTGKKKRESVLARGIKALLGKGKEKAGS